ncbi:MAG: glycosyltransferase family 2 protein [Myxococcales bacterium]|nr:glycosyltransferase family 2 protein [Myxococcales bacterium]
MPTCEIFIPAYQAAATLEAVIERIPDALWDSLSSVRVINDGSTDDTDTVVRGIAEKHPKVLLHSEPENHGYGAAVRRGLRLALEGPAEYVVCLHADGQYPPEKLPEFLPYMQAHGIDVLQGSRHKEGTARAGGMPLYKVAAGHILTWLENKTFGLEMTDYHSGFMLYSRKAVEQIPFDRLSTYFDFDLEVIASARARGLTVAEQGIPTRYADEESHLNPIWYGLRCLRVMLRYRLGAYRP